MIKTFVVSDSLPEEVLAKVSPDVLSTLLSDLMAGARAFWIQKAAEQFTSSRREYINGIQEVQINGLHATIELVGTFPNMLEHGADPWDMHNTLLKGPNVKVSKDGNRYRAIPFRHQTPTSSGVGGGTPMGSPYSGHPLVDNAQALGKIIHREGKKLAPSTDGAWGGRLGAGLAPKLREKHSTDIYAGMVRLEKAYGKKKQNTYQTFRMISDAAPDKWLHPGLEAANIADDVHDFIEKIADQALAKLFEAP